MVSVIAKLDELIGNVNQIESISRDVAEIKSEVSDIKTGMALLEPRDADLETKAISQETRLCKLESHPPSAESYVDSAIEEMNERTLRAKNVMAFGLSETINPGIDVHKFKFFRVGKTSGIKPRPIKVVVGHEAIVNKITRAATKDIMSGLGDDFS
ncbi:hypothetical protein J6590_082103 [Homalodisca vitripennis]|nr:hypothetical protein J6590_082103 [Homalodisca vitripennis]